MNGVNKKTESKIPVMSPAPLRRSGSLRMNTCTPIQEHRPNSNTLPRTKLNRHRSLQSLATTSTLSCEQDDDADSVRSFSSTASVCSNLSQCDHSQFARNGTTYSGRCKRYVVHCSPQQSEVDDYLTPTQRTNRTIRKLRNLLKEAQSELTNKDKEILRLTKELVELRLLKIGSHPDIDKDAELENPQAGVAEKHPANGDPLLSSPQSRYCSSPPLAQSLSDSGHFEDLNLSKDTPQTSRSQSHLVKRVEDLQRQHEDEIRELKEKQNDKVDSLLQRITDVNDRYYALRPLYEDCKEKLHKLEKANEELKNSQSQIQGEKISELESLSEKLSQDNNALQLEVISLKRMNSDLQSISADFERLKDDNVLLKKSEEELQRMLSVYKDEKCKDCNNVKKIVLDGTCQTEIFATTNESNLNDTKDEQNHNCQYKEENAQLNLQIVAFNEKLKQVEEQQHSEKDIYMQLYNKGIQAATLLDKEELQNGEHSARESSLIPDLLQKLKIKQEELDNVKSMYRRLLEARKQTPTRDPEMTLKFLKSAFYYFLTDRDNAQGHLTAIESILEFTEPEKSNIEKAFLWR